MPPPARRTWVYLNGSPGGVALAVWTRREASLVHAFTSYEVRCFREMRRHQRRDSVTRELELAESIHRLVSGDVCYAFYSRRSSMVKLGRTTSLLDRWSKLETSSGSLLQLLAVWQCADSREAEHLLMQRFAAQRLMGEWFDADDVLAGLRNDYQRDAGQTRPGFGRRVRAASS